MAFLGGCAAGRQAVEVRSDAQLRRAQFEWKKNAATMEKVKRYKAKQQQAAEARAQEQGTQQRVRYFSIAPPAAPYVPFEKRGKVNKLRHVGNVTRDTYSHRTVFPFRRVFRIPNRAPTGFKSRDYVADMRHGRKKEIPICQDLSFLGFKHGRLGKDGRLEVVGMRALAEQGGLAPGQAALRSEGEQRGSGPVGGTSEAAQGADGPAPAEGGAEARPSSASTFAPPASDLTSHCTGDTHFDPQYTQKEMWFGEGVGYPHPQSPMSHEFRNAALIARPQDANPHLDAFRSHLRRGDNLAYPASPENKLVDTPPPGEMSRGKHTVAGEMGFVSPMRERSGPAAQDAAFEARHPAVIPTPPPRGGSRPATGRSSSRLSSANRRSASRQRRAAAWPQRRCATPTPTSSRAAKQGSCSSSRGGSGPTIPNPPRARRPATPSSASEPSVGYDGDSGASIRRPSSAYGFRTSTPVGPPRPHSALARRSPTPSPAPADERRGCNPGESPAFAAASFPSSTLSRLLALREYHERSRSRARGTPPSHVASRDEEPS
eukprot:TRINITY_DN2250_c1_g1_i4.p1 TRINITY_DN2250_c1_g1~~TRINITY_DN2250_c1_g1_i4.p1  ORF type:complete len:546 (+),score=46.56 TRINITY_DN2250_c1_g1_i4:58-1695(+)